MKHRYLVLRTAAVLALSASLFGCFAIETAGGYAAECNKPTSDGWAVNFLGHYERQLPLGTLEVGTSHLYYSDEPGTLIEISARLMKKRSDGTYPEVLFDPSTAYLVAGDKKTAAIPEVRESPYMQGHWKLGGKFPIPANLNQTSGGPVVTFPVRVWARQGFVLHLGALVVDGERLQVPDIQYCYLPSKSKVVPFHG